MRKGKPLFMSFAPAGGGKGLFANREVALFQEHPVNRPRTIALREREVLVTAHMSGEPMHCGASVRAIEVHAKGLGERASEAR